MREIVCINIGQGGVQMSNAAWELFCVEHGVGSDGRMRDGLLEGDSRAFGTFFYQSPTGQCVPRLISVDLEPTVIDEVRTGPYRQLFHPDSLISGEEDAASNFARGHYTVGKTIIDPTIAQLRKVVDNCDHLEGFLLISSYGGGTGSGFQTLILERLAIEYSKRIKISVVIFPCPKLSTSTVEPYNAVLTSHFTLEHGDMSICLDNESVYDICYKTLDIVRPTYSNLNRVIAQIYSSMTVSLRYESSLNADLDQMVTNLIPYPRIHFEMINYSPIFSVHRAIHEQMSAIELTRNLFDSSSQLLQVNLNEGKYMSCCIQYRGDVTPREVNEAIFEIKKRTDIKFVDWCPTGFKIGINSQPPAVIPGSGIAASVRSVTMIGNSSSVVQIFERINQKFNLLYFKRAFVHWFVGEGMEEGEFSEAHDNICYLIKDYQEVELGLDERLPEDQQNLNKRPVKQNYSDVENEAPNTLDKTLSVEKADNSQLRNNFEVQDNFENPDNNNTDVPGIEEEPDQFENIEVS